MLVGFRRARLFVRTGRMPPIRLGRGWVLVSFCQQLRDISLGTCSLWGETSGLVWCVVWVASLASYVSDH